MKLIVGLGNPGEKYAHTRHNAGFWVVDAVAEQHNFPAFQKKFEGLISKGKIAGEDAVLLKPQTFMNLSGGSVQAAVAFYKLALADVWVLHDELDLPVGTVKTKQGGGSAGHNGLKDITKRMGADYHRVRIGISHPRDAEDEAVRYMDVADYVLQPLKGVPLSALQQVCADVGWQVPVWLESSDT